MPPPSEELVGRRARRLARPRRRRWPGRGIANSQQTTVSRGDETARENHLAAHAAAAAAVVDFYLHSDHFLWVNGAVAGHDALMFLDTGMVTLDPRGNQPAGGIVPERVQERGLATADGFTESVTANIGPVGREVSSFGVFEDGRNLVRLGDRGPDVRISHGFLKNYTWTIAGRG